MLGLLGRGRRFGGGRGGNGVGGNRCRASVIFLGGL